MGNRSIAMRGHVHGHAHSHAPAARSRAFAFGVGLNVAFIVAEVAFGVRAHSLALLADAGHNVGDALGLGLAWGALTLGQRPPTERHTYGLRRASILAALANALLLLVAVGGIAWEALQRLGHPEVVAGGVVMAVAGLGVVINGGTALLFISGRKEDINVRGAFQHMAADAVVSLGVVVAGFAMARTGWLWLDPAVSLVVGGAVVWGTWSLLRESLSMAMDAVPQSVNLPEVESYLRALPGITAVHDLHIWAMSTTEIAMTVHLVKPDADVDDALLQRINRELHDRFRIEHTTIQLEREAGRCEQAPPNVV
jgi:cobalt-zinc-cadmium efflux system protein